MKLFKLFQRFLDESATFPTYVVENITESKEGLMVHYRLRMKSQTMKQHLTNIVLDDEMINMFDPKTVRTLTYLLLKDCLSPDLSLDFQKLDADIDASTIRFKSKSTGKVEELTLSQISKDRALINKLDPKEAHRIGFHLGYKEGHEDAKQLFAKQ